MDISIYILIFSALLVGILTLIYLFEDKIKKRKKKVEKSKIFKRKLKKIAKLKTEEKLEKINKLARRFFKKKGYGRNTSYTELAKKFKKEGKERERKFCIKMEKLSYDNEKISKQKVMNIYKLLEKILSKN